MCVNNIYIGGVKIAKTAALAPMADVADTAFRLMAKKFGAAYVVGEMTSAKGLVYGDRKTAELLAITPAQRPMAVQLFGQEAEFIAKAVELVLAQDAAALPDIIDINAGCPVNKVVRSGAGSALMRTPDVFEQVITAAAKAANRFGVRVPITVKIRTGWDEKSVNAVQIAQIAQSAGAAAITVHGRTRMQMYSGVADWRVIADVKNAVQIPVIGNGDVCSRESAALMYEQTGCDLVMVGRAAYGRPWIFSQIADGSGEPDLPQRLEIMREHIELAVRLKGEHIALRESRKQAAWYLKGMRGAAALRHKCMSLETLDDLYGLISEIKEAQP